METVLHFGRIVMTTICPCWPRAMIRIVMGSVNGVDAFPDDPSETADSDSDGVGDILRIYVKMVMIQSTMM